MAKNIRQGSLNLPVTRVGVVASYPASPVSGNPVCFGRMVGVAEADMDATTSITTINTSCIAELVVQGKTNGGSNSAVVAGDDVYASLASPIVLSKDTTGRLFGIAYGNALVDNGADTRTGTLVASGATTTTIRVLVGK